MKRFLFVVGLLSCFFISCSVFNNGSSSVSVSGITFSESRVTVAVGESRSVHLSVSPSDASGYSVSYSLSSSGVVSLSGQSNSGVVLTGLPVSGV